MSSFEIKHLFAFLLFLEKIIRNYIRKTSWRIFFDRKKNLETT